MSQLMIVRTWLYASFVLASVFIACGGGGDASTSTGQTTATATAAASRRFVQSEDQGGPAVWLAGEPSGGLAIAALCTELGGNSKLGVNGNTPSPPSSVGSRYVAITRLDGTWALWLASGSSEVLPKVSQPAVAGRELVARIDQGLTLGPGDPYLACN